MKTWILAASLLAMSTLAFAKSQWLSPSRDDHTIGSAHVERTQDIQGHPMTVKLFHAMPVDAPSFNPWFLRLAVVNEDNNSWNVYALPNVSAYQVLPSAQSGYMKIALSRDDYNTQTGKRITHKSTLFINLNNANRTGGKIEIEEK